MTACGAELYTDCMSELKEVTAEEAAVRLDDLYGLDEALAYVNERLGGEKGLSMVGFKRHIYDDPARPSSLFQLEPLPIGRREYARHVKAAGLVFTRRMLDEYLANREHNARRGVERTVTRPTDAERAAVLGWAEALALINGRLAAEGLRPLHPRAFQSLYRRGRLPVRTFSRRVAVYTTADLDDALPALIDARRTRRPRGLSRHPLAEWLGAYGDGEVAEALARQAGQGRPE